MTELERLQTSVPINSLTTANFEELAAKTPIERLAPGQVLFKQGDVDNQAIYLLAGEVEMSTTGSGIKREIGAGTDQARYALAQLKPRQYTVVAKTEAAIARVDSVLLDRLLTMEQMAGYEVTEYDGAEDGEWMLRMLRSPLFEKLPPANINALFARMESMEVKAGQAVIKQGDPGDYYYIIKSGRANVSRKSDKSGKVVILGELGEGAGFGEEALLSSAPRNATVVMAADGVLMRLAKDEFNGLMKEPMVRWVTEAEVRALVHAGAGLVDVRLEDEFRAGTIKGGVNIPLYMLRLKAASLDPKRKYIVYCQTGSRSCAAAFLLSQKGYDVYALNGGLNALTKLA